MTLSIKSQKPHQQENLTFYHSLLKKPTKNKNKTEKQTKPQNKQNQQQQAKQNKNKHPQQQQNPLTIKTPQKSIYVI